MIAHLRPYPVMKPTGMQWLEDVPEQWALLPPKRVLRPEASGATIKNTASSEQRPGYVPAFSASGQDVWLPAASHHGDALVLSAVGAQCGKTFRAGGDWGVVANTQVLRPAQTQSCGFWWYVTNTPDWWERAGAAQPFVRVRSTLNRMWAIPPIAEQCVIVCFLDHAHRRIQRYIRAKLKLLALLEEQTQAFIHQVVTGQTDVRTGEPYPAYRPSGVDWLGSVPEHWEVRPLTRCTTHIADYRGATPTKTDSGVFLVTARNIKRGSIDYRTSQEYVSKNEYAKIMRRGLPLRGDLLLTTEAPLGNLALVDREDIALAQRVIRFRLSLDSLLPEFALHSALDPYFQNQLLSRGTGSTAVGIKASKLPQLKVLCPSLDEQQEIVGKVVEVHDKMGAYREAATRQIGLLSEYKTRLTSEVVAGKADVRKAASVLSKVDYAVC